MGGGGACITGICMGVSPGVWRIFGPSCTNACHPPALPSLPHYPPSMCPVRSCMPYTCNSRSQELCVLDPGVSTVAAWKKVRCTPPWALNHRLGQARVGSSHSIESPSHPHTQCAVTFIDYIVSSASCSLFCMLFSSVSFLCIGGPMWCSPF